ncbi:hypothetical protein TrST_g2583 [Triparma strigata]|uniref:TTI1 C-terminal TPR domain-containing protein n=1 Tax=Triparma strigata TaxID=1606541 RepID=A0A9W7BSM0_9STRA|nr:hypothetical protein TrST_g2583 [Triparma strigata]
MSLHSPHSPPNPNTNTANDEEDTMIVIYAEMKPFLDSVMFALTSYKRLPTSSPDDAAVIASLKTLTNSLKKVHDRIASFSSALERLCLAKMSAFVLLPSAACLQHVSSALGYSPSKEPQKVTKAIRPFLFKAIEGAADNVKSYCQMIENPVALLPVETLTNTIVALAMSLPPSAQTSQDSDRDSCTGSVLTAVASFFATTQRLPPPPANLSAVSNCLGGGVIAQIVQASIGLSTHADNDHKLQALTTISSAISLIPRSKTWAPLFPGTFSAVFKAVHDGATKTGGSVKVAAKGLGIMGQLMEIVCRKEMEESKEEETDIQAMLKNLVKKSKEPPQSSASALKSEQKPTSKLSTQTKNLVPLLTLTLNTLRSHPSPTLRHSCSTFAKTVLLDCGGGEVDAVLIDSIMLWLGKGEGKESAVALSTVGEYRRKSWTKWETFIETKMSGRLFSLIEGLTSLARSHSAALNVNIDMCRGYLGAIDGEMDFMSRGLGSSSIIDPLLTLVRVDVAGGVEHLVEGKGGALVNKDVGIGVASYYRRRFEFLDDEGELKVRELVKALAAKMAEDDLEAVFLDILDRFQVNEQVETWGNGWGEWIRKWGGAGVILNELATGGKVSVEFSQSTIGLITGGDVWRLPTTVEGVAAASQNEERRAEAWLNMAMKKGKKSKKRMRKKQRLLEQAAEDGMGDVSAATLNGNAYLISSLMEVIGTFAEGVGEEFVVILPEVLYLLVEKVGSSNMVVNQAGLATMMRICSVLKVDGLRSLVRENMDYLVDSIVIKLRGEVIISESVCQVINVLMNQGCPMVLLEDVVNVVLGLVDGGVEDGRVKSVLSILAGVVQSVKDDEEKFSNLQIKEEAEEIEPYLQHVLDRYSDAAVEKARLEEERIRAELDLDTNAKDFFKKYHEDKEKAKASGGFEEEEEGVGGKKEEVVEEEEEEKEKEPSEKEKALFKKQVAILNSILDRAVFYLVTSDISVIVSSFTLIQSTYAALGELGNIDGNGDPLLIAVNNFWGAIVSKVTRATRSEERKKATFLEFGGGSGGNSSSDVVNRTLLKKTWFDAPKDQIAMRDFDEGDTPIKERVETTKLLQLASFLCGRAGAFMGKRLAEVLELCGRVLKNQGGVGGGLSDLEVKLFMAALRCLNSAVDNCPDYVEVKTGIVTGMVLGWLGAGGSQAALAVEAEEVLKKMCRLDVEKVWPGLERVSKGSSVLAKRVRGLQEWCMNKM